MRTAVKSGRKLFSRCPENFYCRNIEKAFNWFWFQFSDDWSFCWWNQFLFAEKLLLLKVKFQVLKTNKSNRLSVMITANPCWIRFAQCRDLWRKICTKWKFGVRNTTIVAQNVKCNLVLRYLWTIICILFINCIYCSCNTFHDLLYQIQRFCRDEF